MIHLGTRFLDVPK
jgi:5-methyltetrahydrofolate--homocysteine methyltransferase